MNKSGLFIRYITRILALLLLVFFSASCQNGLTSSDDRYSIKFNKVGGLMYGAPAYREDTYYEDISLLEAEAILGADIRNSLPESLSAFEITTIA